MSTELEGIPFDHYQRYAATAMLVDALLMPTATVLEVGANRQRLLASFSPRSKLVFSDLFEQAGADDFVQADASALPFADARFDAVVALDVIEHMPVHLRAKAAAEMARVAGRLVVIACPLDQPWVHEAEDAANGVWRNYFGEDYPWLEEHKEFGLVAGDQIEQALVESGCMVLRFGQGDTAVWSGLMSAHFVKEAIAEMRPIVASADRLYNHSVFAGDRSEKSYREYFVAVRNKKDLERIRRSPVLTAQPDGAAVALLSALGATLQPIADRIKFAERQWQLAASKVVEGDAKLSAAAAEWGHAVALLRESEAKQLHASQQWQATAELVHAAEASLEDAREQWAQTVERLKESEAKQLYAAEQWRQTAERFREAETQLEQMRSQHQSLTQRLADTDARLQTESRVRHEHETLLGQTLERLQQQTAKAELASELHEALEKEHKTAVERMGLFAGMHESLVAEHTELTYHQDRLLLRIRGLERRQRWALGSGIVVLLAVLVAFLFRLI